MILKYKQLSAVAVGATLMMASSCTYDPYETDIEPVRETMTLVCETPEVEIDEDHLTSPALTFTWTGARPLTDEYMSMYKAELDVLGNSFGSRTVITSGVGFDYKYDEEKGIYCIIVFVSNYHTIKYSWLRNANLIIYNFKIHIANCIACF